MRREDLKWIPFEAPSDWECDYDQLPELRMGCCCTPGDDDEEDVWAAEKGPWRLDVGFVDGAWYGSVYAMLPDGSGFDYTNPVECKALKDIQGVIAWIRPRFEQYG